MMTTPKKPVGRALADEAELSDEELDRVTGGAGGQTAGQETNDGWSKIVDDHATEVPAAVPADRKRGSARNDPAAPKP